MSIVSPVRMTISPNMTGWSGLQGKIGAGEWRRFGFSFDCEIVDHSAASSRDCACRRRAITSGSFMKSVAGRACDRVSDSRV